MKARRQYIGVTSCFGRRIAHHKVLLNGGRHHNKALQRDWTEFGPAAFRFALVEKFDARDGSLLRVKNESKYLEACAGPLSYNHLAEVERHTAPNGERIKLRSLRMAPSEWAVFDEMGGMDWLHKLIDRAKPPK